jgi:single-stranded-DNA-specific exonuclease
MAEWKISPPAPPEYLAALRDIHLLTAQILYARGLTDAESAYKFISGTPDLINPFAFADAVARILTAVGRNEPIAVYADYDCDGITAGVLLVRTLISLGARADLHPRLLRGRLMCTCWTSCRNRALAW